MFASVPYHIAKASQATSPNFSPTAKLKHIIPSKRPSGLPTHAKNNPSLTGWSQNNSLNASGIVGDTFRQNNNLAPPPVLPDDINLDSPVEKPKDSSLAELLPEFKESPIIGPSVPDQKIIAIVPEAAREESVPQSRKRSREVITRNIKSPAASRPSPLMKSQKSPDFHNSAIQFFHSTRTMEFPLSIPASPGNQQPVIKEKTHTPTTFYRASSPMHRTSYSKLLADPLRTTQDFKVFRMGKLKMDSSNNSPEKRSATVLKTRPHQQTLYIPTTVLSGSKLVKYEDPGKQKNLRMTKGLQLFQLWSQVTQQNNSTGESIGLKYSEPLSLESPGVKTYSKTPVGIITTKVFNFTGENLEKEDGEVKTGLFPKFKPTMKAKKPTEDDKSDLELSQPPPRNDILRMRQTSPFGLFTLTDFNSSSGFIKRKASRNLQQRSEIKRRPTKESFKDDTDAASQDINIREKEGDRNVALESSSGRKNTTQRVMDKVTKIIKKKSIEVKHIVFEGESDDKKPKKPSEPKFVKIESKIEVDGKSIKRSGKNVRVGSSSLELTQGIKDLLEVRADALKLGSIKNFKLFENKP